MRRRRWLEGVLAAGAACGPGVAPPSAGDGTGGTSGETSSSGDAGTTVLPDPATGSETGGTGGSSGLDDCEPDLGATHRYVWVPNPADATVLKIDTSSETIVGRYFIAETPSAAALSVSVTLGGDAIVVATDGILNDATWAVRIHGDASTCANLDGKAGIQTSTGDDPLPWGKDDCVEWTLPQTAVPEGFFYYQGGRAGVGTWNRASCRFDEEIWAVSGGGYFLEPFESFDTEIIRIAGAEGTVTTRVAAERQLARVFAVDTDNALVGQRSNNALARIDPDTFEFSPLPFPSSVRDIAFDDAGRRWGCGGGTAQDIIVVGEPGADDWTEVLTTDRALDCTYDGRGSLLWIDGVDGGETGALLRGLDVETLELTGSVGLPDTCCYGLAVDFEGKAWTIEPAHNGNGRALLRIIDPSTGDEGRLRFEDVPGVEPLFGADVAWNGDPTGLGLAVVSGFGPG